MSDAANWSRVRDIFSRALAVERSRRDDFLHEACEGDVALHKEVSALLAAHAEAGSLIEGSPIAALDPSAVSSLLVGLRAGDRIGSYTIAGKVGAGGMGEVYEARDTQLDRRVAIKILSPDLTPDGTARERFVREAKSLAALNHPNIGAIYGFEKVGASAAAPAALILELVEGQTLAERVARGPLSIDEVVRIGAQIASALEAAHDQGIIHRDLKPGNIKITPTGTVKVLDFGLAKATERKPSADAATAMATRPGTILGTPAYMSPEQVRGEDVDKRTDIWAFGCVLFELLTGRKAFGGRTTSDCVAAVLEREPDWSAIPPAAPDGMRALLRRCLQKDRHDRLRDAGDAGLALKDLSRLPIGARVTPRRALMNWGTVGLLALVVAALGIPAARHLAEIPSPEPPEMRVEIVTPESDRPKSFALSPDGRHIVYVAFGDDGSQLWLRSLSSTTARPLPGTKGASYPFWKPDGTAVAFFAAGKLKRLDLGGSSTDLADAPVGLGGTWNADEMIVFAPSQTSGLMRVPARGGSASAATTLAPQQRGHVAPFFLPGGHQFLFYAMGAPNSDGIYLGTLDGPPPKRLTPAARSGTYLASGWLLWLRSGDPGLLAQRLDTTRGELTGETILVARDVVPVMAGDDGVPPVSVSATGLVAYRSARGERQLVWFDRSGSARGTVGEINTSMNEPRVSPDGQRVVAHMNVRGNVDLFLLDRARTTRLTFDDAIEQRAVWSPDGDRIAFRSDRAAANSLEVIRANGEDRQVLVPASNQIKTAMSWSARNQAVLYRTVDSESNRDIWFLPMTGNRIPAPFLRTPARESHAAFSPDGRWVAYQSDESGPDEIYVRLFAAAGESHTTGSAQRQISKAGGIVPTWRADGREIFFLSPTGAMMAAKITVQGSTLEADAPVQLFQTRIIGGGVDALQGQQYDVAPDGRFLINTELNTGATPITLLMNWKPEPPKDAP